MRVHISTFYDYKNKYPDFSEAIKKGKEIVDYEVEKAFRKKTQGYNVLVLKNIKVKHIEYDPETGRKISEVEELREVHDEVHVPADTAAQIYWLKCRRPDKWREKDIITPEPTKDKQSTDSFIKVLNKKAVDIWADVNEEE